MTAAASRRSASARTLDGRVASSSDRTPSSMSREMSFSKTLSSADAYADVVPEALSFEKLEEAVALLEKANLVFRLENEIFQDKLDRENPDLLSGLSAILEEEAASVPPPSSKRPSAAGSAAGLEDGRGDDGGLEYSAVVAEAAVVATASPARSPSHATTLSRSEDATARRSRAELSAAASDTVSGNPRLAAIRARAARASGRTSKTGSLDRVPRMSFSQRIDLAEEAAYLAAERARSTRTHGAAVAADLRARAEEAHSQLTETRSARQALEDGVVGSGDPATGRASSEKFARYIADLVRQADATVERLRLKASSLRAHHRRVRADVAVKRELGEALRPVDFDKIRIEIEEYNRKINNKNQHLVDLKNISGSATSRLLASKKRLSDLVKQLDVIHKETATKRSQIVALEREEQKVLEDVGRADQALNAIRVRMERHEAPDVLDYVRLKEQMDVIRRDCTVWERRCNIQQQTSRDLRRAKGQHLSARVNGGGGRADGGEAREAGDDTSDSTSSDGNRGRRRTPSRAAAARATTAPLAAARRRRALRRRSRSLNRHRPRSSSSASEACASSRSSRSSGGHSTTG